MSSSRHAVYNFDVRMALNTRQDGCDLACFCNRCHRGLSSRCLQRRAQSSGLLLWADTIDTIHY